MDSLRTELTAVNNKTLKSELASTAALQVAWAGVAQAPDGLKILLEKLVKKAGSQRAAADILQLGTGRLGKVRHGDGALETWRCGLLAEALGVPLGDVLRSAGKNKEADVLQRFATSQPLSHEQREWLTIHAQLSEGQRKAVAELIRTTVPDLLGSLENPGSTRVRGSRPRPKRRAV